MSINHPGRGRDESGHFGVMGFGVWVVFDWRDIMVLLDRWIYEVKQRGDEKGYAGIDVPSSDCWRSWSVRVEAPRYRNIDFNLNKKWCCKCCWGLTAVFAPLRVHHGLIHFRPSILLARTNFLPTSVLWVKTSAIQRLMYFLFLSMKKPKTAFYITHLMLEGLCTQR